MQFSNHTGFPLFKGTVMDGEQLWTLIEGLEANKLIQHTHLLTGGLVGGQAWDVVLVRPCGGRVHACGGWVRAWGRVLRYRGHWFSWPLPRQLKRLQALIK